CRMEAEQEHQQRSHQRPAADAGHADQHPDNEAGQRIERVVGGKDLDPRRLMLASKIHGECSCSGTRLRVGWYLQLGGLRLGGHWKEYPRLQSGFIAYLDSVKS